MNLLPGEKIILESDNKSLCLTTHRIRYALKTGREQNITSIMLEELDACKVQHLVQKTWLYFALITVLLSVLGQVLNIRGLHPLLPGLILAGFFYFMFFITRKAVITIYAGCASADILTKGMSLETVTDFINEVEKAKNKRYLLGNRGSV